MKDDNNNVVRVVVPVYPVVERSHTKVLEHGGFLNPDGYLDILALIHATAILERKYHAKVTAVATMIGLLAGYLLHYLF